MTDPRLVPEHPELVTGVQDVAEVTGVFAQSSPFLAIDSRGRRWIRKLASRSAREVLLAESTCWMLARALDVPIPAGAYTEEADPSWLSEYLEHCAGWTEEAEASIRNPRDLGATFALDAVVMNEDRHADNALLQPQRGEADLLFHAIDFDTAIIGYPKELLAKRDRTPHTRKHFRVRVERKVRDGALAAAEKAVALDTPFLDSVAEFACRISGLLSVREHLQPALVYRCRNATELVRRHLDALERLP